MLSKKNNNSLVFQNIIWKNHTIKSRMMYSLIYGPLFFFSIILIFQYFDIDLQSPYLLLFLFGTFYHFFVTVFAISAFHSYLKFILINKVLFKTLLMLFISGVCFSLLNIAIIFVVSSFGKFQFDMGEIIISFLMGNFIFPLVGLWISSYDFAKINLFEKNIDFLQPRATYMVVGIVSVLISSLLCGAYIEYEWPIGYVILVIIVLFALLVIFAKFMFEKIYFNLQKSIVE